VMILFHDFSIAPVLRVPRAPENRENARE
jgi:hypothetical protein